LENRPSTERAAGLRGAIQIARLVENHARIGLASIGPACEGIYHFLRCLRAQRYRAKQRNQKNE
jgi:hypothetical protein